MSILIFILQRCFLFVISKRQLDCFCFCLAIWQVFWKQITDLIVSVFVYWTRQCFLNVYPSEMFVVYFFVKTITLKWKCISRLHLQKKTSLDFDEENGQSTAKQKTSSTFSNLDERHPAPNKSSITSNASRDDPILSVQQSNTFRQAKYSYF